MTAVTTLGLQNPTVLSGGSGGGNGLSNPVTPPQGGTGVANNAASTLTISGAFGLTLTLTAATSLTLPTSGTVTALGNTTTGSGSIVLATAPGLTGDVTITSPGSNANTLTINDAAGDTSTSAVTINANHITTGNGLFVTSSSITSGSAYNSVLPAAATGAHFFAKTGTTNVFNMLANGNMQYTGILQAFNTGTGVTIDLSGSSSTTMLKTASGMEFAKSTGTCTMTWRTSANVSTTGWIQFTDHAGAARYIPYV